MCWKVFVSVKCKGGIMCHADGVLPAQISHYHLDDHWELCDRMLARTVTNNKYVRNGNDGQWCFKGPHRDVEPCWRRKGLTVTYPLNRDYTPTDRESMQCTHANDYCLQCRATGVNTVYDFAMDLRGWNGTFMDEFLRSLGAQHTVMLFNLVLDEATRFSIFTSLGGQRTLFECFVLKQGVTLEEVLFLNSVRPVQQQ